MGKITDSIKNAVEGIGISGIVGGGVGLAGGAAAAAFFGDLEVSEIYDAIKDNAHEAADQMMDAVKANGSEDVGVIEHLKDSINRIDPTQHNSPEAYLAEIMKEFKNVEPLAEFPTEKGPIFTSLLAHADEVEAAQDMLTKGSGIAGATLGAGAGGVIAGASSLANDPVKKEVGSWAARIEAERANVGSERYV